ncbi:alpha/beta hydrolase [Massilia terrae]|uniref:Alpha/beta hydrolase n=1 Tax=Massilia terrae TaxID=1811224 RepID=A0ABT2CU95_9BURK|nr:alpha/beta hydrolase [Massilia terrae]MCS0657553.1 alpha/beta hydrolase [Massilia terrae]
MTKPLLHFSHGNSFPAGTYSQLLDLLGRDYDVRSIDMHGHDPAFPVDDGWHSLVAELIARLESHGEPAILVGHSLGGALSLMAAYERPDLARCVVMLDSPVVAGWRAALWSLAKRLGWGEKLSPARLSWKRRNVWPDRQSAYEHFASKPIFAAWAPGVLHDYLDSGLAPHPDGVQLRFTREVETDIYSTLPHDMGKVLAAPFPVPVGCIAGTRSEEMRQAGLGATRQLVGPNLVLVEGGHLYPMEQPALTARLTGQMIENLLGGRQDSRSGRAVLA